MPAQNSTTKTSDLEVLNIEDFYKIFQSEKRRYAPSLFCVGSKTKAKRKESVSFVLYKRIILEYLKFYFFDLYNNQKSSYFFLGGFMKKITYPKWVRFMGRGTSGKQISGGDKAIGLFWYMRPSMKMYYMVKLKKLTGSSNRLPKIEKFYSDNFNKDLLPIFKAELKKAKENKTLYLCTLT